MCGSLVVLPVIPMASTMSLVRRKGTNSGTRSILPCSKATPNWGMRNRYSLSSRSLYLSLCAQALRYRSQSVRCAHGGHPIQQYILLSSSRRHCGCNLIALRTIRRGRENVRERSGEKLV